jgi:SagB-type dehydrogenase family enzyme
VAAVDREPPRNRGETTRAFHEQTKNSPRGTRLRRWGVPGFRPMDPWNQPAPFKRYPTATRQPLPTDLPFEGPPATEVLAGQAHPDPARVDRELVARQLFFSGGVTRVLGHGPRRLYFRTAASAGNLHPLETYLVCGDLPGLDAGLYHFAPDVFGLERLRGGDYREFLAGAAVDSQLSTAPAALVVTGIPWRTAWKYGERGWRHIYWDLGTMMANLLAVAEAHGVRVRLLFGFRDAALCRLLGIDGTTEFPLVVITLNTDVLLDLATDVHRSAETEPLQLETTPLSRAPIDFPLITAAQQAGCLESFDQVHEWRAASTALSATAAVTSPTTPLAGATEPIEVVILRRGSTRSMRHEVVPADLLVRGMACATRPVPVDAVPTGRTLLAYQLSVHAVDGIPPGHYDLPGSELRLRQRLSREQTRAIATHLCLDQALGGDSAYTAFVCTPLNEVLDVLGDRGYRVVQAEAGIVVGRLQLAAFALGYGATGLTFYDDAVSEAFGTDTACMIACSVGVPAYESRPGGPPLHPTQLGQR